jgi:hypothetical protein
VFDDVTGAFLSLIFLLFTRRRPVCVLHNPDPILTFSAAVLSRGSDG